jgi:hypothetical protein
MAKVTGLSGNEIYCLALKQYPAGVSISAEIRPGISIELTRLEDGFGVRRSSSSEVSPLQVWRLSPSCS